MRAVLVSCDLTILDDLFDGCPNDSCARCWHHRPMVLKIHIEKVGPGLYRATMLSGSMEVTATECYCSIEEAIRDEAEAVPAGLAHFVDVTYEGASSGTISLAVLPERASQVANQLIATVAEMNRIAEL